MPVFNATCQNCGVGFSAYRTVKQGPPKFHDRVCRVRGLSGRSLRPVRWPLTQEIQSMIVKVYQTDTGNGQVRALAIRIGYPRWKVTRYAIALGLIAKQKKEPDWTEREIHLLELNAHLSPERIQKKLNSHGFNRSMVGIVLKRKRMRMLQNLEGMSATALSECFGVDVHFITRAIAAGRLKAERRGTGRIKAQGGDMWYIRRKDIRAYILAWLPEIDIRKVDKYWFCDLIASRN